MESLQNTVKERLQNLVLEGFDPVSAHGFTQVPNVIIKHETLSPGAKITYSLLLSYAWNNNRCFPGQETLAKDMCLSDRQVRRFLRELEDEGYLETQRRGLGKTNIYVLKCQPKKKESGKSR